MWRSPSTTRNARRARERAALGNVPSLRLFDAARAQGERTTWNLDWGNIMQAISVHYVPPTDTKGARWRVRCDRYSVLLPYDHTYRGERAAWSACVTTLARFGWQGEYLCGQTHDGTYVFVPIPGTREKASGIDGAYRYDGTAQGAAEVLS